MQQSVEDIRKGLTVEELNAAEIKGLSFLVNVLTTLRESLFIDLHVIEVRARLSRAEANTRIIFTGYRWSS